MINLIEMEIAQDIAFDILKDLYDLYPSFERFISYGRKREDWFIFRDQIMKNLDSGIVATNGSFRAVLIDEEFDWVIKFDFYDCSEDSCCHMESILYNEAIDNKVEEYFAPCFYGGKFKEVNFYLMRKVYMDEDLIEDDINSSQYDMKKLSYKKSAMYENDAEVIFDLFSNYFNYDDVSKLINFCSDYEVGDLHTGNIGYFHNHPVIIDYAY